MCLSTISAIDASPVTAPAYGSPVFRRADWYHRLHARLLAKGNAAYDAAVSAHKTARFGALRGTVLEIGAGAGANLGHLRRDVHWIAVEPNVHTHATLRDRATARGISADVMAAPAEQLPLADASVDHVICSLVLCTVRDVDATLDEIRRVLRPGGRFAFIEHVVGAPRSSTRHLQRALRGPWSLVADGCRPDQDTVGALERAGFEQLVIDRFDAPLPAIVRPHIAGVAVR